MTTKNRTVPIFLVGVLAVIGLAGAAGSQTKYEKPPAGGPGCPERAASPRPGPESEARPAGPRPKDGRSGRSRTWPSRCCAWPASGSTRAPTPNGSYIMIGRRLTVKADRRRRRDARRAARPASAGSSAPQWNADGTMFAFTNEAADGDRAVGRRRRHCKRRGRSPACASTRSSLTLSSGCRTSETLLVKLVPADRGAPPEAAGRPPAPRSRRARAYRGPAAPTRRATS